LRARARGRERLDGSLHAVATIEAPPEASTAPGPPARRFGLDKRDALAVGILLAAFALPLRGLLRSPGPPMEEGFMLVFPERVLHGAIPNKDFLHLYGPGSLWFLAGVFKVFGTSLMSERVVGLLQQMSVAFGVFAIARRWGRGLALGCGLIAVLFLVPLGLVALAWVGAVGLGLLALAAGAASRDAGDSVRGRRLALVAGLLMGLALLYRIDLVLAVALSALALGATSPPMIKRRFGIGFGLGLSPYLIHLATAGPGTVVTGMITDPLFKLRGGRSLPIPPPWGHFNSAIQFVADLIKLRWPLPTLAGPAQLTVWFFLLVISVVGLTVVGVQAVRRDRQATRPRVLLAAALFSVGIMPQALQRADGTHLAWVSCAALAFVPLAAVEFLGARSPRWASGRRLATAAVGGLLLVLLLAIPDNTFRGYANFTAQTFGLHRAAYTMSHRGRIFYYGRPDDARAANRLTAAVERVSKPGDRLFVGPQDLRKTPESDAYFYYLLPQLKPATYYIEMDPGVANANDSGLAAEIHRSDVLILSSAWNYWDEPNNSRKVGSDQPNKVVRTEFCRVGRFGSHFELFTRCKK
jgi:4-amino-4-deoxy-L-arabinose transferase-like glycosyltransferase